MDAIERRARHAAHQNAYYHRDPEGYNARQRARLAADPDKAHAQQAARRAVTKPWTRQAAKAAKFAFAANRRAERAGVPGRLSATQVRTVNGPCAYCGAETVGWDHVVPMVQGGPNTVANLVSCCPPCNWRKHHRTPEQAGMPIRRAS